MSLVGWLGVSAFLLSMKQLLNRWFNYSSPEKRHEFLVSAFQWNMIGWLMFFIYKAIS